MYLSGCNRGKQGGDKTVVGVRLGIPFVRGRSHGVLPDILPHLDPLAEMTQVGKKCRFPPYLGEKVGKKLCSIFNRYDLALERFDVDLVQSFIDPVCYDWKDGRKRGSESGAMDVAGRSSRVPPHRGRREMTTGASVFNKRALMCFVKPFQPDDD